MPLHQEKRYTADERRDIRRAVVLLGTGQEIPEDLRNRLLARMN